jgi:hypothetical protein
MYSIECPTPRQGEVNWSSENLFAAWESDTLIDDYCGSTNTYTSIFVSDSDYGSSTPTGPLLYFYHAVRKPAPCTTQSGLTECCFEQTSITADNVPIPGSGFDVEQDNDAQLHVATTATATKCLTNTQPCTTVAAGIPVEVSLSYDCTVPPGQLRSPYSYSDTSCWDSTCTGVSVKSVGYSCYVDLGQGSFSGTVQIGSALLTVPAGATGYASRGGTAYRTFIRTAA